MQMSTAILMLHSSPVYVGSRVVTCVGRVRQVYEDMLPRASCDIPSSVCCQGSVTWTACVHGWAEEAAIYSFQDPGFSAASGHFTQVPVPLRRISAHG